MKSFIVILLRRRYFILCAVVFALMLSATLNGIWVGDFWEHSAVVKELSVHPLSPTHPMLALKAPHAFYSPYSLGVALFARSFELTSITALAVAGLFNLILFFFAFWFFINLFLRRAHADFYALLFTLLLWGSIPWSYSNFFHLRVLNYVLPYPSTFCTALSLLAFSFYIIYAKTHTRLWIIPITIIITTVLISHPYTFIFLAVGLAALFIGYRGAEKKAWLFMGIAFTVSFTLAAIWPLYPFFKFAVSGANAFHGDTGSMYVKVFSRTWPALLGIFFIVLRLKKNRLDPLFLAFTAFFVIYLYGYTAEKSAYGRVIAFIIFTLHTALADKAAGLERKIWIKQWPDYINKFVFLLVVFAVLLPISFQDVWRVGVRNAIPGRPDNTFKEFSIFRELLNDNDVVLTDMYTGWLLPSFNGRVVATNNPLAFIDDQLERRQDVKAFFNNKLTLTERNEIINKYNVDFIVFNKQQIVNWQEIFKTCYNLGRVILDNNQFTVLRLHVTGESVE